MSSYFKKLLLGIFIYSIFLSLTAGTAYAVGDSDWRPNTYDMSGNPLIKTITGGETLGSTSVCIAPIFHFSNVFPNMAGGKLTQIRVAMGPVTVLPTTAVFFIMDTPPSTTLMNSCIENSAAVFTQADNSGMLVNAALSSCVGQTVSTGFACLFSSLDTSGAEPKNTDVWVGIAVTSALYVVPSNLNIGIRLFSRY